MAIASDCMNCGQEVVQSSVTSRGTERLVWLHRHSGEAVCILTDLTVKAMPGPQRRIGVEDLSESAEGSG